MRSKFAKISTAQVVFKRLFELLCGTVCGFVNGFFGGGGGLLAVPFLCLVAKLGDKQAHATALAVMLPLTLVSLRVYFKTGISFVDGGLWIVAAVTAGGVIGAVLLKILPEKIVRFLFNLVMIGAGLKMFFR